MLQASSFVLPRCPSPAPTPPNHSIPTPPGAATPRHPILIYRLPNRCGGYTDMFRAYCARAALDASTGASRSHLQEHSDLVRQGHSPRTGHGADRPARADLFAHLAGRLAQPHFFQVRPLTYQITDGRQMRAELDLAIRDEEVVRPDKAIRLVLVPDLPLIHGGLMARVLLAWADKAVQRVVVGVDVVAPRFQGLEFAHHRLDAARVPDPELVDGLGWHVAHDLEDLRRQDHAFHQSVPPR